MKLIKYLSLVVLLAACKDKTVTEYQDVKALRASLIYSSDSVYAYMQKYGETNKAIAGAYMEKGKKEESTNPEKAVFFYKRAITLNPTLETYKQLAKVLYKQNRTVEVHDLYAFLVMPIYMPQENNNGSTYVFGKPDEDLYYEYLVSGILHYHFLPADDVYGLKESGYDPDRIKQKLVKDERLKLDTASAEFKTMMLQFLPYEQIEAAARQPVMFMGFLSTIKDTSAAFEIGESAVADFNYEKFNGIEGDDFMQMSFNSVYIYYLKEKQDEPKGWFKFNFNHHLKLSPAFNTVVYAVDSSEIACPREMRHVYHRLATYDNTGSVIDSKVVASQSGNELSTFNINRHKFSITRYERAWKNPYQKTDFDNELLGTRKVDEVYYDITPEGKITEIASTD